MDLNSVAHRYSVCCPKQLSFVYFTSLGEQEEACINSSQLVNAGGTRTCVHPHGESPTLPLLLRPLLMYIKHDDEIYEASLYAGCNSGVISLLGVHLTHQLL